MGRAGGPGRTAVIWPLKEKADPLQKLERQGEGERETWNRGIACNSAGLQAFSESAQHDLDGGGDDEQLAPGRPGKRLKQGH